MKQKLLLISLGLSGFLVASVGATILQTIVGGLLPNTAPDPPGEMAPDPVREATTKKYKGTSPEPKKEEPQQTAEAAPQESTPTPAPEPAPAPAPTPAPPPPTTGPGNIDVPHTYYPSAPATGPGNL